MICALLLVAALVHLPAKRLPSVLSSVCKALTGGGHLFVSLKEGSGQQRYKDGRIFTLWQVDQLIDIFKTLKFDVLEIRRQDSALRSQDCWIGFLVRIA